MYITKEKAMSSRTGLSIYEEDLNIGDRINIDLPNLKGECEIIGYDIPKQIFHNSTISFIVKFDKFEQADKSIKDLNERIGLCFFSKELYKFKYANDPQKTYFIGNKLFLRN